MTVRFNGITQYLGKRSHVNGYLGQSRTNNGIGITSTYEGHRVLLDGNDTVRLLKDAYQMEVPTEIKGKTLVEAAEIFRANPAKYLPLVKQIATFISDPEALTAHIKNYIDARKSEGKDADGNTPAVKLENDSIKTCTDGINPSALFSRQNEISGIQKTYDAAYYLRNQILFNVLEMGFQEPQAFVDIPGDLGVQIVGVGIVPLVGFIQAFPQMVGIQTHALNNRFQVGLFPSTASYGYSGNRECSADKRAVPLA